MARIPITVGEIPIKIAVASGVLVVLGVILAIAGAVAIGETLFAIGLVGFVAAYLLYVTNIYRQGERASVITAALMLAIPAVAGSLFTLGPLLFSGSITSSFDRVLGIILNLVIAVILSWVFLVATLWVWRTVRGRILHRRGRYSYERPNYTAAFAILLFATVCMGGFVPLSQVTPASVGGMLSDVWKTGSAPPVPVPTLAVPTVSAIPSFRAPTAPTVVNPPSIRANPTRSAPVTDTSAIESQIVAMTNEERRKAGLPALTSDSALAIVARDHSADMLRTGSFSHTNAAGESATERAARHGYPTRRTVGPGRWIGIGENIYTCYNYPASGVAAMAVQGWMTSPGHRANILNVDYRSIGVGVAHSDATFYMTQNFL